MTRNKPLLVAIGAALLARAISWWRATRNPAPTTELAEVAFTGSGFYWNSVRSPEFARAAYRRGVLPPNTHNRAASPLFGEPTRLSGESRASAQTLWRVL